MAAYLLVCLLSVAAMHMAAAQNITESNSCFKDVAPFLNALFSSLGNDCTTYASLFTSNAQYFHQHDGYKTGAELLANCKAFGDFCPDGSCKFLLNGEPFLVPKEDGCHMLVPYIWSEIPANHKVPGNLEPHNGWEYIVTAPCETNKFGYCMSTFCEIETSYSVAYNWAQPDDTPAVVESTLELLKKSGGSKGECDKPIAPVLTTFFTSKSNGSVWRQQGDAVVLAAGGICHAAVPYAAEVDGQLKTGYFVLTMSPQASTYKIEDSIDFPLSSSMKSLQSQVIQI